MAMQYATAVALINSNNQYRFYLNGNTIEGRVVYAIQKNGLSSKLGYMEVLTRQGTIVTISGTQDPPYELIS